MIAPDRLLPDPVLVPEDVQWQASGVPITEQQLASLLAGERVQIVRVVTRTLPKFHRGSPFKPRSVVSICVRTGFIGADYLRVVHAQQVREGLLDLAQITLRCRPGRLWRGKGQHVAGNRHLVRHTGSGLLYLVLYPRTNCYGTPIESARAFYTADQLELLDASEVNRWRVVSRGSNFPRTRKRIPWRLPCLGSITSITIAGAPYALVGERSRPMCAAKRKRAPRKKPVSKRVSKSQAANAAAVRLQAPLEGNNSRNNQQQNSTTLMQVPEPSDVPLASTGAPPDEAPAYLELPPELLEAIRAAKLGEPREAIELRPVSAAGVGALSKLAIAANEAARRGRLVSIFTHRDQFVICVAR